MTSITTVRTVLLWALLPIAAAGCQSQPPEPAAQAPGAAATGTPPEGPAAPARGLPRQRCRPLRRCPRGAVPENRPRHAPPPAFVEVTVPAGTELSIELLNDLSSETATVETAVRGRLRRAVEADGRTVLPAGATLTGAVTEVVRPGKVKGRASLSLQFTHVTVNGERSPLATSPITVEGESSTKRDAAKIGIGAGAGAVVGGILGGGSGAAKGAAIGGGAGTAAVLATRGKDVVLASGTALSTTLSAAKTVELPR